MLSLYHGFIVSIRHFGPELVFGGSFWLGLKACKGTPMAWRVGRRVEDHVVGRHGGRHGGLEVISIVDEYKWSKRCSIRTLILTISTSYGALWESG